MSVLNQMSDLFITRHTQESTVIDMHDKHFGSASCYIVIELNASPKGVYLPLSKQPNLF